MDKLIFIISLLFPGLGHLMVKKYKTFLLGLVYFVFIIFALVIIIIPGFQGIAVYHTAGDYAGNYTIGAEEYTDNSFLIIMSAVFSVLLLIVLLLINSGFAYTARKTYLIKKSGMEDQSFKQIFGSVSHNIVPHAVSAPAYALMILFMVVPAIVSIIIVFTNYRKPILPPGFLIEWSGFDSFRLLFQDPRYEGLFESTIVWTIVWTLSATILTIALGMGLAVIAHNKRIKGKKFFRTVYLLPWAIPAFLSILVFQIFFSKVGTMNTFVLPLLTGEEYTVSEAIPFLIDKNLAKMTIILIQGWLGFPYVFTLTTGILQGIPDDLYESSSIDGGNPWTNFWDITFPIVMITAAPLLVTQFTFNFNNVTIIYMLSQAVVKDVGQKYFPTDTIASLGFRLTIDANYATAAAMGLITSVVVSTVVIFTWIKAGAFKREEVM